MSTKSIYFLLDLRIWESKKIKIKGDRRAFLFLKYLGNPRRLSVDIFLAWNLIGLPDRLEASPRRFQQH